MITECITTCILIPSAVKIRKLQCSEVDPLEMGKTNTHDLISNLNYEINEDEMSDNLMTFNFLTTKCIYIYMLKISLR